MLRPGFTALLCALMCAFALPGASALFQPDSSANLERTIITVDEKGSVHEQRLTRVGRPKEPSRLRVRDSLRGRVAVDTRDAPTATDLLFNRFPATFQQLGIVAAPGENVCFAGLASAVAVGGRCNGFRRVTDLPAGTQRQFIGYFGKPVDTTLRFTTPLMNIWTQDGPVTMRHAELARAAVDVITNTANLPEYRPAVKGRSWVEGLCNAYGPMPFWYSCSDRINVIVLRCNTYNAFSQNSYLYNFPNAVGPTDPEWADINFALCLELLDGADSSASFVANVMLHELTHTVQQSLGDVFNYDTLTEGHATYHEGPGIIGTRPRPMSFVGAPSDWNPALAGHMYALTGVAGRFYQFHAGLLATCTKKYGLGVTERVARYNSFAPQPGRRHWEYFLENTKKPAVLRPTPLGTVSRFLDLVHQYRVSIASTCLTDPTTAPDPYRLYQGPWWYCTTLPTFWANDQPGTDRLNTTVQYGGSATAVIRSPINPTIEIDRVDIGARVTVLAEAEDGHTTAHEVAQPSTAPFLLELQGSFRQLLVTVVNTDPVGEFLCPGDPLPWYRVSCPNRPAQQCWSTNNYASNTAIALRSPPILVPADGATLSFNIYTDTEPLYSSATIQGCPDSRGWDGANVRVLRAKQGALPEPQMPISTSAAQYDAQVAAIYGNLDGTEHGCEMASGFAGRQPWRTATFALDSYAGERVMFEFAFFSDAGVERYGVAATNFVVRNKAGTVIYRDAPTAAASQSTLRPVVAQLRGQQVDSFTGVPSTTVLPAGCATDLGLTKRLVTKGAIWTAHWEQPSRLEQYVGYPYVSANFTNALVTPAFEALVPFTAPFDGSLSFVDVVTTGIRQGVGSLRVSVRRTTAPYAVVASVSTDSLSVGPAPGFLNGVQRFEFPEKTARLTGGGQYFFALGVEASTETGMETKDRWVGLPLCTGPKASVLLKQTNQLQSEVWPSAFAITGLFRAPL